MTEVSQEQPEPSFEDGSPGPARLELARAATICVMRPYARCPLMPRCIGPCQVVTGGQEGKVPVDETAVPDVPPF